jgi:hypothetical protein
VATQDHQAVIPDSIVQQEEERGFDRPGILCQTLAFVTNGVAIGTRQQVSTLLDQYRKQKIYKRRINPIPQVGKRP